MLDAKSQYVMEAIVANSFIYDNWHTFDDTYKQGLVFLYLKQYNEQMVQEICDAIDQNAVWRILTDETD